MQVLQARLVTLGPEHADTLQAMHDLGVASFGYDGVEHLERALQGRQRVLGPAHPDTNDTWAKLCKARASMGMQDYEDYEDTEF